MLPSFLNRLQAPEIDTVLLCGCGGGFDFLHGLTLYPALLQMGKTVVIGSYSFGDPGAIGRRATVVFERDRALVKRVTAASEAPSHYAPEIHLCSYLDDCAPDRAPHFVYAYYARAFSPPVLADFYRQLLAKHDIDAVVLVDGGSDSLMVGDEEGLGDPIEDAVSVAAVADLEDVGLKLLLSLGFGADRYNHVSDAASLRAVAELTARGGYLGSIGLDPDHKGLAFYRRCIEHIYERQSFRSALTGFILSAAEGFFGSQTLSPWLPPRVQPGGFFIWPLMAMIWAFDVEAVADRSLIVDWIRNAPTVRACHAAFYEGRSSLGDAIRDIEDFPRHVDMRA